MNQLERIQAKQTATEGIVVSSCSLAELFSSKAIKATDGSLIRGQLHLPEYQRPYRWGEAELSRLFSDLRDYFEPIDKQSESDHDFFMGSVILHQEPGERRLNIIDGQQRLTTMGLLAWLNRPGSEPKLSYESPLSQQRIRENTLWMKVCDFPIQCLDLKRINVVLVVTRSQDDAYRFFETQNTGGVRLYGEDIIKAHHLRAVVKEEQESFSRKWEKMGSLKPVVGSVLMARFWQALSFRELPSKLQKDKLRLTIVDELAERTGNCADDVVYQSAVFSRPGNRRLREYADGYDLRQPLNAGVNTINYLLHFEKMRKSLLSNNQEAGLEAFHVFYQGLITELPGCGYLKSLYDSTLMAYVSRFGYVRLAELAMCLFRVVYSRRVSNKKSVREKSIDAFVRETPVFDWILQAYTPEQCIDRLKDFKVKVDPDNLGVDESSVKRRFVNKVDAWFGMDLPCDEVAMHYDVCLREGIMRRIKDLSADNAN